MTNLKRCILLTLVCALQQCSSSSLSTESTPPTDVVENESSEPKTCDSDQKDVNKHKAEQHLSSSSSNPDSTSSDADKAKVKATEANTSETDSKPNHDQCTLYLAKSSIPNGGIGIFTSVDFKEGDHVGEDEIVFTVTDSDWDMTWLLHDVQWGTYTDERFYYESNEDNDIFIPGFGAQINCHFGLNNMGHGSAKFDSAGVHRGKDAGAGAFSYWHGMSNVAKRDIKAGEELFIHYGEGWFDYRSDSMGVVPSEADFKAANTIIASMHKSLNVDLVEGDSPEAKSEAWSAVIEKTKSEGVKALLPERYTDLEKAHELGAARYSVGGEDSFRTQEWLDEHGICMDTMYVNISTIPQAGRGAFAKRSIEEGAIISPHPMLQINRTALVIPHHKQKDGEDQEEALFEGNKKQLLTNYAYGHVNSDIFLVPYNTLVNFINHDGKHPNAKIRWSESPIHRKEYLELGPEEVLEQGFGLLMEIVALRDIAADEEVLIDYGPEWEAAWLHHQEHWIPTEGSAGYISAADSMEQSSGKILPVEEQKDTPYPSNIQTACHFYHTPETVYDETYDETDEEGKEFTVYHTEWKKHNYDCLRHCEILGRSISEEEDGDMLYDVYLLPQTSAIHEDCIHPDNEKVFVNKIPSKAVSLVDRKFTRDQHLSNAFRHVIGLPDEVLPANWLRNKVV